MPDVAAVATVEETDLGDVLRASAADVRKLQDARLARTVELCYEGHPFYRALMRREGLEPRHVRTCDDLVRLPPTTKADFLADPEAFRLGGDQLTADEKTLWKLMYTTGTTTGVPAPIYVTTFDYYAYLQVAARRREFTDVGEQDIVANLFPLTRFPLGAYVRAPDEIAAIGAQMFFAHPGRPVPQFQVHRPLDEVVRFVAERKATVLWGISSFVRRVLIRAGELGVDFSSVRLAMVTGETTSDIVKADMERRMVALGSQNPKVINRYGSTEQGSSMVECQEGAGFHNLAPDQVFLEVVNPATGARLADGERSHLAFTHLIRRGTVFLRYLVGDLVRMSSDECLHCGRTSPRIVSQPVRTGDILKVRGTQVNLQALKECLERMPEVDEYQIVIKPENDGDPLSPDQLLIRLAAVPNAAHNVGDKVAAETLQLTNVRPEIELVVRDAIFDPATSAKARRIIDRRESVSGYEGSQWK